MSSVTEVVMELAAPSKLAPMLGHQVRRGLPVGDEADDQRQHRGTEKPANGHCDDLPFPPWPESADSGAWFPHPIPQQRGPEGDPAPHPAGVTVMRFLGSPRSTDTCGVGAVILV